MVASLDGFIAKKDGDISWLDTKDYYDQGVTITSEDIEEFLNAIDCYVMGSRTFEQALTLGWPYGRGRVYVLTNRTLTTDKENVEFYSGDIKTLVEEKLKPTYKNIWMVGGAECAKAFIKQKLVDNIVMSIAPIILGDGTLFFDFIGQEQRLHLKNVTAYDNGMVELWYEVKNEISED